jgi:hypothetical protein
MSVDKKALKKRLLERYEVQLDEMLEQIEDEKSLHLTEIEEMALQVRQAVGASITEELAVTESQKQAVDVACPECQQNMRYKGRKPKWMKTRSADVRVERAYYYCATCKQGHFPPR